jgi:putative membrane protein
VFSAPSPASAGTYTVASGVVLAATGDSDAVPEKVGLFYGMNWLKRFLWQWGILTIAIIVVVNVVSGVSVTSGIGGLLVVALVLGLANSLIRPVARLLTLPLIIATFGLFAIVVNVAMLYVADAVTGNLHFAHIWDAVLASLIISVISAIANRIGPRSKTRRTA